MQRKREHDIYKKDVEPDNELLIWENWIKIRHDEVIKLAENLNKPPVDLAMNLLEKVREDKEWKMVLEQAQIEKKPKLRGRLWEQPLRLKQYCPCLPAYEVKRTAIEKNKLSVIEHVCVPQYIQETEKGFIGNPERRHCSLLDADFVKYREKRENDLKEKITKIDPFRPKECLMVRGYKPRTPPPKLPPIPTIKVTEVHKPMELTLSTVYALRINNTIFFKNIPGQDLNHLEKLKQEDWHEDCTTWYYYFNNSYNRAGRCKILLQNLGTVSLRYCWKKLKRTIPFIPEVIYEQVFFFNKNEDVLSPGQCKEIQFTFLSDRPGIYCEAWEISFCNICFFDTLSEKICVNLSADAVENAKEIGKKVKILQARVEKKAITNFVVDILDELITKATEVPHQEYPYKHLFVEAEIFLMKNPVCFYHQTEVQKLKDYYTEMCRKSWDLSLITWRQAMIENEFEDRMKYYDLLKKSHADLLKPWREGEDLLKQKRRVIFQLLGQMADNFEKKYNELVDLYTPQNKEGSEITGDVPKNSPLPMLIDTLQPQIISNLFYLHAYEYVCTTIEMCAGILSSMDLNRWIEFDFCQT